MGNLTKRLKLHLAYRWREHQRRKTVAAYASAVPSVQSENHITVTRIIGNDLYPRHAEGQTLRNLEFLLEKEQNFPNCRKVFVINRLFDPDIERTVISQIEAHGHTALPLPFTATDYSAAQVDTDVFGGDGYFESKKFAALKRRFPERAERARVWALRHKICYAMGVNGARNMALADGRENSDWTLVLDGSCFLSRSAFDTIRNDLSTGPFAPYLVLPMTRLVSNDEIPAEPPASHRREEPQLGFHRTAKEEFDLRYPYGMRSKVELLERLGVPGPWIFWDNQKWTGESSEPAEERHFYKWSSTAVFRLTSGIMSGALEDRGAHATRYASRTDAILRTLLMLDERCQSDDAARVKAIVGRRDDGA